MSSSIDLTLSDNNSSDIQIGAVIDGIIAGEGDNMTNWTNQSTSPLATSELKASCNSIWVWMLLTDGWYWQLNAVLSFLAIFYIAFGISVEKDRTIEEKTAIIFQTFVGSAASALEYFINSSTKMYRDRFEKKTTFSRFGYFLTAQRRSFLSVTLVALVFCLPELILPSIGMYLNDGERVLGSSCIIGSASVNILLVTGIAMCFIDSGQRKIVLHLRHYLTCLFFAVFSLAWMIIITFLSSPQTIELWEAIATLLMYGGFVLVVMVIEAISASVDYSRKVRDTQYGSEDERVDSRTQINPLEADEINKWKTIENGFADKKEINDFLQGINKIDPQLPAQDVVDLATYRLIRNVPHSLMWARIDATRELTGNRCLQPKLSNDLGHVNRTYDEQWTALANGKRVSPINRYSGLTQSVVEFTTTQITVCEKSKNVRIGLKRMGRLNEQTQVKIETVDGSAKAGSDYVPLNTAILFERNEATKYIDIAIVEDKEPEPDEIFFVRMVPEPEMKAKIGHKNICTVTIIDDEKYPEISFPKASFIVKENVGRAQIPVKRMYGFDKVVSVKYKTEDKDMTATAGDDYEETTGTIIFEQGECEKYINVDIIDDKDVEKMENFKIILHDPSKGVRLGKLHTAIISILDDEEYQDQVHSMSALLKYNTKQASGIEQSWAQQFELAMSVNGGDHVTAEGIDYCMHFITFLWKVLAAFLPPPSIFFGLPTLLLSLAAIAGLTICIYDMSIFFSCIMEIDAAIIGIAVLSIALNLTPLVTAITSAKRDRYADNAIAFAPIHVTVTLFVSLGIIWTIEAQDETLYLYSDTFRFAIVLLTILFTLFGLIITLKRVLTGAELGGNRVINLVVGISLVLLWFAYVVVVCMFAVQYFSLDL